MAKLRDAPITASDLREYLDTQDDFALELFAFREAKVHGFFAAHGGTYEDAATRKTRQFDVRASIARLTKHIDLTIECKSLTHSAPLLVSRVPRSDAEAFHQFVYSYTQRGSRALLGNHAPAKAIQIVGSIGLYPPSEPVGKALSQVGRTLKEGELVGSDSEVYDKWYQALASANDLVQDAIHARSSNPAGVQATVILPILVVSEGALWVADYSEDGVLLSDPYQTEEASLYVGREYWRPASIEVVLSHLQICTKSGLSALLARISKSDDFWEKTFPMRELKRAVEDA